MPNHMVTQSKEAGLYVLSVGPMKSEVVHMFLVDSAECYDAVAIQVPRRQPLQTPASIFYWPAGYMWLIRNLGIRDLSPWLGSYINHICGLL